MHVLFIAAVGMIKKFFFFFHSFGIPFKNHHCFINESKQSYTYINKIHGQKAQDNSLGARDRYSRQ
jgi:hypothetical protein